MCLSVVAIFGILIPSGLISGVWAQSGNINWYKVCNNSIVGILISEPCSSLTTNGGFTLTPEGNRVLACIGGGALALAQHELMALKSLTPCGSNYSTESSFSHSNGYSNNQRNDPIGNIINGLLG